MIDKNILDDGIRRIAKTADGKLLYLKLQHIRMGIAPSNVESGALRLFEGQRILAANLMALMAEAMSEDASGGSGDPSSRPIVYNVNGPAAVAVGQHGAKRRVGPIPTDRGE